MTATPIADMVAEMAAKGAPLDAILLAIRAVETSRDAIRDASRSVTVINRTPAAIRAARYREKRKQIQPQTKSAAVAMAGAESVTAERDTSRDGVTTAPLSILTSFSASQGIQEVKLETKKEVLNTEPRVKAKRQRGGGSRMTEDWTPDAKGMKIAADRGLRLVEIEIEITKFRNYWINRTDRDASKPRWDLAWQNWILNVRKPNNGQGQSVIAAADRLIDKIAEFERGDEPDLLGDVRSGAGAPHVRLLSAK